MDIGEVLKKINKLTEYHTVSQDFVNKLVDYKILLNLSTILSLKKVKSFEIQYFSKYEKHGIGFVLFKQLLCQPSSKTWGLMSKDLVSILQYWLYTLRINLITKNQHWWTFLEQLLKFVKELRLKDSTLPNILVEETGSNLLELTMCQQLTPMQRFTVLHCFNICSAESSRECRLALQDRLDHYFTKLSESLNTCGHFPTQLSVMETLLRWLVNRHDLAARQTAAQKWFKADASKEYVKIFLDRQWIHFFQDVRDFLNAMNEDSGLVTSVACKRLSVGNVNLISEMNKRADWLDVNSDKCLTVVIDPRSLRAVGVDELNCEILTITEQDTVSVYMKKDTMGAQITVKMSSPPRLSPSGALLPGCDVTAIVSDDNLSRLDKALLNVFAHKYQSTGDRVHHPLEKRRVGHSGQKRAKSQGLSKSPSSISTSSLAQLHEKLAALPPYTFDKEPVSVCLRPDLSNVIELNETERSSLNTSINTFKSRPYGECYNKHRSKSKASQSDGELPTNKLKCLSPANSDKGTSLLLVATIGSANESVINDSLQHLPKDIDFAKDNIVDLLVQEALNTKTNNNVIESDKDAAETAANGNNDVIEATQFVELKREKNTVKRQSKQVDGKSSPPIDVSISEIDDTQNNYVNLRKRNVTRNKITVDADINLDMEINKQAFTFGQAEDIFSRHWDKNEGRDFIISPTFVRNINETPSESCDSFNKTLSFTVNEIDIIECLNSMVNKVCSDFEKCSEYLNKNHAINVYPGLTASIIDDNEIIIERNNIEKQNKIPKPKKEIKLTYKIGPTKQKVKKVTTPTKNGNILTSSKNNLSLQQLHSTIVDLEKSSENIFRKKRKLYSPKDEQIVIQKTVHVPETEDEITFTDLKLSANSTPKTSKAKYTKSSTSCYKYIENERARVRRPYTKSKKMPILSPKINQRNLLFDQLKTSKDNGEKVTLVNVKSSDANLAVYNFDSDDDDFKNKSIQFKKRVSSTNAASGDTTISTKRGRVINKVSYDENLNYSDDEVKVPKKQIKPKNTKRRGKKKNSPKIELIDERIRKAPVDDLSTSLILDSTTDKNILDPEFALQSKPQMEILKENCYNNSINKGIKNITKKKKNIVSVKKEKKLAVPDKGITVDEINKSPLPGFVIEKVQSNVDDPNDSLTANMIEKFRKAYIKSHEVALNETNTTYNLLADIDKVKCSPTIDKDNAICDLIQEFDSIDNTQSFDAKGNSEKSIPTVGHSPITAHGDFDEAPPSPDLIHRNIEPRDLDTEDLNQSLKDYVHNFRRKVNEISPHRESNFDKKQVESIKNNSKSPVVSVRRLSSVEIRRWLPSSRTTENDSDEENNVIENTNQFPGADALKLVDRNSSEKIGKSLPSCKSSVSVVLKCDCLEKSQNTEKFKSMISPIKLFEDIFPKQPINDLTLSDDEDYIREIKEFRTKENNATRDKESSKKYFLRKYKADNENKSKSSIDDTELSSVQSELLKKRKLSSVVVEEKKRKVEVKDVTMSDSGPSVSSVNDWFKRNARRNYGESNSKPVEDCLEDIMEKLETTLEDINENTTAKFVRMFVGVQEQLNTMKEQLFELHQFTAKKILTDVVKTMDEKFNELHDRSQREYVNFKEDMKQRALELIKEDCEKKRVMVKILKDDVKTALENVRRKY